MATEVSGSARRTEDDEFGPRWRRGQLQLRCSASVTDSPTTQRALSTAGSIHCDFGFERALPDNAVKRCSAAERGGLGIAQDDGVRSSNQDGKEEAHYFEKRPRHTCERWTRPQQGPYSLVATAVRAADIVAKTAQIHLHSRCAPESVSFCPPVRMPYKDIRTHGGHFVR